MARVLIVDDDRDVLESLEAELEEAGHEIVAVNDAGRALASAPETFDLVLVDLWMRPGASGLTFKRQLDERRVAVPIVLMSSDDEVGTYSVRGGFFEYLHKPFSPDLLHAAINRAAADSPTISATQQPAMVPEQPTKAAARDGDNGDS
jgi:DNA-binding NtrC family response regulator